MSSVDRSQHRVAHVSSAHPAADTRIFVKECSTLAEAGFPVTLVAVGPAPVTTTVDVATIRQRHSRVQRAVLGTRDVYRALRRGDHAIIHLHDPELLPLGLWLSLRGRRVIYDAHETLRDDVSAKPYLTPRLARLLASIAGRIEDTVARRAAHVVAATPVIARQFPRAVTTISNYPIIEEWASAPESLADYTARPLLGSYVGGIIDVRCRDEMVAAAGAVARIVPGFTLHFAGTIDPGDVVPAGDGVRYDGVLDRHGVDDLLGHSRFGMVLMKPLPNLVTGLPTKFFEYLAAGLPVVVSRSLCLVCDIVDDLRCGVIVDESDPQSIAAGMRQLLEDPTGAFDMGRRGHEAVLSTYNWAPEGARLVAVYDEILADAFST